MNALSRCPKNRLTAGIGRTELTPACFSVEHAGLPLLLLVEHAGLPLLLLVEHAGLPLLMWYRVILTVPALLVLRHLANRQSPYRMLTPFLQVNVFSGLPLPFMG